MQTTGSPLRPRWWSDQYDSAWDRVKDALKRDFEQTKRDFGSKTAPELNQDLTDTVKQAVGAQPIPPDNVPNAPASAWSEHENALRYGYGAGLSETYRPHKNWSDPLSNDLEHEWTELKHGRRWEDVQESVRAGFERARLSVQSNV